MVKLKITNAGKDKLYYFMLGDEVEADWNVSERMWLTKDFFTTKFGNLRLYIEPKDCKVVQDDAMFRETTAYLKEEVQNSPKDPISPEYYKGKIECIDAIAEATKDLQGIEAVDTAQIIKYIWRWKKKNGIEDLNKALFYLNHLIKLCEAHKSQS